MRLAIILTLLCLSAAACEGPKSDTDVSEAAARAMSEFVNQSEHGAWVGGVDLGDGEFYPMSLVVNEGGFYTTYPTMPCRGTLELISASGATAIYRELIHEGTDVCADGTLITLTYLSPGRLQALLVEGDNHPPTTATLHKAPPPPPR